MRADHAKRTPCADSAPHGGIADRDRRVRAQAARISALPQALPLALSAGVYPPALLVLLLLLTGEHPRALVLAYYAGAAILTVSAGLIVFAALKATGVNDQDSSSASGSFDIVLGVLLLVLAAWAWPTKGPRPGGDARGRA